MKNKIKPHLLTALFMLYFLAVPVFAQVPHPSDPVTEENILSLLQVYDQDGYYIIKKTGPSNALFWFTDRTLSTGMSTAVHEQCHFYTGFDPMHIYIGNEKHIDVPITKVIPTSSIADTYEIRTFRYDTYIKNIKNSPHLVSDEKGAYGLLNEFTAYYWGARDNTCMMKYLHDQNYKEGVWSPVSVAPSEMCAFGEFRYYIIHYLEYVRQHESSVYQGIINNQYFLAAYRNIYQMFYKLVREYYASSDARSLYLSDLQKLINEANSDKYAVVRNLLETGVKVVAPTMKMPADVVITPVDTPSQNEDTSFENNNSSSGSDYTQPDDSSGSDISSLLNNPNGSNWPLKITFEATINLTINNFRYVIKNNKAVLTKILDKKLASAVIPASVNAFGKKYKVTGIGAGALKGMKKLKSVTIGKNVKDIGPQAFMNCKKLSLITIKSKKLTETSVQESAFKGIYKKAIVQCPAGKKKSYKKILQKKGAGKKAVFR